MLKKDMNFVELEKVMEEHGYNYSLDAIRQKVGRGTYDARFLYEFAESMGLDIEFVKKQVQKSIEIERSNLVNTGVNQ